jgi:hypothetical protein
MLNISIDTAPLKSELDKLIDRIAKVPNSQTAEKMEIPDVQRSAARILVPKTWQQYYNVELPQPENADDFEW